VAPVLFASTTTRVQSMSRIFNTHACIPTVQVQICLAQAGVASLPLCSINIHK
jgi:hypothetical protein